MVESSRGFQLLAWFVVALIGGALLYFLNPVLTPFVFAAIVAYICDPLVDRLERWRIPRSLGVLLVMIGLAALFVLLTLILIPLFVEQAKELHERLPSYLETVRSKVVPWLESRGIDVPETSAEIKQAVTESLPAPGDLMSTLLPTLKIGGFALLAFVTNLVLVPVVLFYMLRDWDRMVTRIGESIPRRWHSQVTAVAGEMDSMLGQFLRGQLSVMLLLSVFYVTGLWMAGLDFALSIGIISGMLTFIPYVGAIIGFVLATLAGLIEFQSVTGLLPIWGVFFLGQMLEGFVITPWLVGDRLGLHPVLVIFALLAFGQLFGFFGMLLALPMSAVLVVLFRHLRNQYEASALYTERAEGIVLETHAHAAEQEGEADQQEVWTPSQTERTRES
jgi:predicted PurR-regulated permease PerM